MELGFDRCMFSLLKFGGIDLFTCKMALYTYYMRPNYMVYRKAQDFGSVAKLLPAVTDFLQKCMFYC